MTVTLKWVALHEVSDYLAKGWQEVHIIGGCDDASLMVSPEEPASEPAKMECPNCGEDTYPNRHDFPDGRYICQRAGTAKVECPNCGEVTERSHSRYEGPGPDKWSCKPAQPEPAKMRMTDALQEVLNFAQGTIDMLPDESWQASYFPKIQGAIHEVRAQAEQAKAVRLPKVREFLDLMGLYYRKTETDLPQKAHTQGSAWEAALAELDAAEGVKG